GPAPVVEFMLARRGADGPHSVHRAHIYERQLWELVPEFGRLADAGIVGHQNLHRRRIPLTSQGKKKATQDVAAIHDSHNDAEGRSGGHATFYTRRHRPRARPYAVSSSCCAPTSPPRGPAPTRPRSRQPAKRGHEEIALSDPGQ